MYSRDQAPALLIGWTAVVLLGVLIHRLWESARNAIQRKKLRKRLQSMSVSQLSQFLLDGQYDEPLRSPLLEALRSIQSDAADHDVYHCVRSAVESIVNGTSGRAQQDLVRHIVLDTDIHHVLRELKSRLSRT